MWFLNFFNKTKRMCYIAITLVFMASCIFYQVGGCTINLNELLVRSSDFDDQWIWEVDAILEQDNNLVENGRYQIYIVESYLSGWYKTKQNTPPIVIRHKLELHQDVNVELEVEYDMAEQEEIIFINFVNIGDETQSLCIKDVPDSVSVDITCRVITKYDNLVSKITFESPASLRTIEIANLVNGILKAIDSRMDINKNCKLLEQ